MFHPKTLNSHPFYVESEESRILIARYLIEDNIQDHVEYDLERTNKMHIVKSIFKNLIGKYTILNQEEDQKLKQSVIHVLKPFLFEIKSITFTCS